MKMEEQACNIMQMKKLEKLGFDTTKASMVWLELNDENWKLDIHNEDNFEYESFVKSCIPTFSIADMLEMFPESIYVYDADNADEWHKYFLEIGKNEDKWQIRYKFYDIMEEYDKIVYFCEATFLRDVLYSELKLLKENNKI